jgi:predicted transcriptional regulator of viral defense system
MMNYARNQGVDLLEALIQNIGPLFTFDQAFQEGSKQGLSRQAVRNLLNRLEQSNWVARLKRGLYTIVSPIFDIKIHPFAVAQALINPMAISHWSALAHHGFTTQIPPMIQASTPTKVVTTEMRSGEAYRPRGRSVWRVLEFEIEYISLTQDKFWGFTQEWVSDWHRVNITDRERTILDLIARSDIFGGISMAIETVHANAASIDFSKLVDVAIRYDVGSVIKRLGWIMESIPVPNEILEPLLAYKVQNYYLLDPQGQDQGEIDSRWKLHNNLTGVNHA